MRDSSIVQHFFQLLSYSVGSTDTWPDDIAEAEWQSIYDMARQQSLLGILFVGLQRNTALKIDRRLLLNWYALSERIRQTNVHTNLVALKVVKAFADKGYRTCVLKGQGNTLNYPDAYIRTCGDIDLWVEGGENQVLALVRQRVPNAKICYHHADFEAVDGVEVEVHYRPSFMVNLFHNCRLQRWFDLMAEEEFTHAVSLPNGEGQVCVPTAAFNRIYQLAHINNHIINEGIGLRQILDYYYVLKQGFTADEQAHDEALLKHVGLYKIASAVMYVLGRLFHLEERYMLVPPDERVGQFLLDEIMQAGNFGQYDSRVKHGASPLRKNIQRLQRDVRLMWYFPSECLWEPVFRWYHFFWRLHHR